MVMMRMMMRMTMMRMMMMMMMRMLMLVCDAYQERFLFELATVLKQTQRPLF